MRTDMVQRTLAILGFHKVGKPSPGGWETWYYIPEARFAEYLGYLHANGWHVIDLAAFLRSLAEPDSLPERAALLTFDDGYRSLLDAAVPQLLRWGYPGVVFVPTDFIGGDNTFDRDVEPAEAICDWADLHELERQGIAVQSHGASHRAFSKLTPEEQEVELRRSKDLLEAELRRPVDIFAYPYGDSGRDVEAVRTTLERAGYRAACLYGGGPTPWPPSDRYRLVRLAMGPDTDLHVELGSVCALVDRG